ncbi:hypothetical protein OF385_11005 [Glutamicibacter sp. JL.03c]|uniref:hypothetical protein n=1 Tax=Glutamicibacter sp. JL.03c TaxID=2984842 RepID=UPI0021F6F3FB|nr:hypothetical protein [Glutamicibacter sp. JL.03c]UYQ76562.1 hypothetical protein OF385_11005 [Glutamicibacter sp. JL.03c]
MLRKVVHAIVLSVGCIVGLAACNAANVAPNESNLPSDEPKLSISETCDLLDEEAVQHNIKQERALADMALMAKNSEPMIGFLETTIVIFQQIADQTGDSNMRAALLTQVNDYQMLRDAYASYSVDDPALVEELQKVRGQLDVDAMPYIQSQCPGSIVDPDGDGQ